MEAAALDKLKVEAAKHAEEFRAKHGVSMEEWELAEAMTKDLSQRLLKEFWDIWEAENGNVSLPVRRVPKGT